MNPHRLILLLALLVPLSWLGAAPRVVFITENQTAKDAIEQTVLQEYNNRKREDLRVADFAAWTAEMAKPEAERFAGIIAASYREIPDRTWRNTRYNAIKAALGLQDTDPADKGFTDLLAAAGYEVYRSETLVESDPITGASTYFHEFHGDIGEPFSPTGDYRLSQEQIDILSQADLIVVSMNVNPQMYAWAGRAAGSASTVLLEQWNALPVPVIAMNNILIGTMEFGSWGWGWSYGFTRQYDAVTAYDRRDIVGQERFVFPDMRPKVRAADATFLDGVTTVDDGRVPLYRDYGEFPILPQVQVKFSNNKNYLFPSTAKVVLELAMPSFVVTSVGDIPVQNPVMVEFQKGVPAFTPQDGIPAQERVAVPAETRLYFAAGMGPTGLYNLSEAGARVFLNAVAKYAGPAGGGGLTPGEWNATDIGWVFGYTAAWGYSVFMGNVYMADLPWVYQAPFGWMYVAAAIPNTPADGTSYWFYSPALGWVFANDAFGGFFQAENSGWAFNNFLNPNP